ncbi:MAG: hypothetical protein QOH88_2948 [Verrucomicrobiota bacterium]|jgi:hypothetical protein
MPRPLEIPEAYYSRLCPGDWRPHDEAKLVELAQRMKDSEARRKKRRRLPAMPSGYVYFGQFIDHDITRDGRFLVGDANPHEDETPNYRTPALDLDTLYGKRGLPGPQDEKSGELPLGQTLPPTGPTRRPAGKLDDLPREADGTPKLIDPRNEENLVIGQMHVLFIKFHNGVIKLLKRNPSLSPGPRGSSLFEQARRFVTWHYQWIILKDFLPKIARITVLQDIRRKGLLLTPDPINLPIEFTVAAFRFGHSMIQESYSLNHDLGVHAGSLMLMTKRGRGISSELPALPANYVIDWNLFFTAPEAMLNRGQTIDTFITEALYGLPAESIAIFRANFSPQDLAPRQAGEFMRPLPELTLRRGSKMHLPSGEEFADFFHLPKLTAGDIPALTEDEEFFDQQEFRGRTPLWYYLLREAAVQAVTDSEPPVPPDPPMQKLGHIGSRIVAEVLLQILSADSESIQNEGKEWKPPLLVFGASKLPRSLDSMPNLVEFVRSNEEP